MPASLTAAVAAAVLAVLWPLGRRRKPLIRDADTSAVVALNRAQIALVQSVDGAPTATLAGLPGRPPRDCRALAARNRRGSPAGESGQRRCSCPSAEPSMRCSVSGRRYGLSTTRGEHRVWRPSGRRAIGATPPPCPCCVKRSGIRTQPLCGRRRRRSIASVDDPAQPRKRRLSPSPRPAGLLAPDRSAFPGFRDRCASAFHPADRSKTAAHR